jgi:hypothetical protein
MKGFMNKAAGVWLTGGLALVGGCHTYQNLVDPCYPQRYEYMARQEVYGALAPQVANGHVLDQTVWNYDFEQGSDRLTPGGMAHLNYLVQRRPAPDGIVYLQTAHDLSYDPAAIDKFAEARAALDTKRIQSVQNYLTAQTAGRQVNFEVVVHDPGETGLIGQAAAVSALKLPPSFQGALPTTAGAGSSNVAGGAGAGAGGGSGSAGGSGR